MCLCRLSSYFLIDYAIKKLSACVDFCVTPISDPWLDFSVDWNAKIKILTGPESPCILVNRKNYSPG